MTRSGAMTAGQACELLGLPLGADADALGHAYRTAVKTAHPDRGGDAERLRQIIEAHRLLKALVEARMTFAPAQRPTARPAHQSFALKITVREALAGGRRRVTVAGGRTLNVRLPKGLRAGDALRLKGMGDAGVDIVACVSIRTEGGMSVRGDDLWLEVTASADQLKTGARLEIDTPRGRRALKAPEGAAEGRVGHAGCRSRAGRRS